MVPQDGSKSQIRVPLLLSYPELLSPHALSLFPLVVSQQSVHKANQEINDEMRMQEVFIKSSQNTTMKKEPFSSSLFSLK